MSPDMAKSKRSSFSNDLITETIELDMSPLSIMARGAEPPEFMLPPAVHEPRMLKFGSASMPVLVVFFTLLLFEVLFEEVFMGTGTPEGSSVSLFRNHERLPLASTRGAIFLDACRK